MARINLSVPDELKAEMDSVDLNWSAIAQEAFSTQIKIQQLKGTSMNMEAGIERLRANKMSNDERTRAKGYQLGKEWALNTAEYDQLERVARMVEAVDAGDTWSGGICTSLAREIDEDECEAVTIEDVFSDMRHDELTDNLIEGFIEGAAEVFAEV